MLPWLELYPNREMACLLSSGFRDGFYVPRFEGEGCLLSENLQSVCLNLEVVRAKLANEVREGRMAGPFSSPPLDPFRVSPLGLVPKREPNAYRLIHHLSFPDRGSLNYATDKVDASVSYASLEDAITLIRRFGPGALIAKADVKSAFRLLPVAPSGFNSLGIYFENGYYVDKCLPMGFTLSCFYFESFASFLQWVVMQIFPTGGILHYLDDFLFVGPAGSDVCDRTFQCFARVCSHFGVPLAAEKSVAPCQVLEFLGITLDTVVMEFRLPLDKLVRTRFLLSRMLQVRKTTLRDFQSLLGLLCFSCKVIPMGRVFCRRLYMATRGLKHPGSHVRLVSALRDDLRLWDSFLSDFNGHSMWQSEFVEARSLSLFTDAAGSFGFGAFWAGHWCAEQWPVDWIEAGVTRNITLLELFPVLVSLALWGQSFANKRILLHTDNKGVLYAINCLSSGNVMVVRILRHIVWYCLRYNIWLKARHLPGVENSIADSLSRFQMNIFRLLVPDADLEGVCCPDRLWRLIWD